MNRVRRSTPPSAQAKQPSPTLIVCNTAPPSRTRTHRLFGTSAYQTAPSTSRQMPSGTPSWRSAHTRLFDRLPSAAMSNAVSFLPYDSATINVEVSGVTAMPFGNAIPSATRRVEPMEVTPATIPGANFSPAMRSKPPPLTYALPRLSTTISLKPRSTPVRSACVTSEPFDSLRRSSPSFDETMSKCPSGSQSKQIG